MSSEHFQQSGWTLDDLIPPPTDPVFDDLLADLEHRLAQFEQARDLLSPAISTADFLRLMRLYESIQATVERLTAYAQLWFAADTQSQDALGFLGRMEQLHTEVQNRLLFFPLWWKGLDDEPAARLIAASGDYAYYLKTLRLFKPYTLSEPEERVINLKDVNGSTALVKLYEMLTSRFTFRLTLDGESRTLTRAELSQYFRDPAPEVRAAAYRELLRVYSGQGQVLAQIYNHRVRDWANENLLLRGFSSPIAVRNLDNDLPDSAVETLLAVCRENMPLFHRYFRWKARQLGMERLRRYDIYAPVGDMSKTYSFDRAAQMVLESLGDFSPVMAEHARRLLVEGHIDSAIRTGKQVGAFCHAVLPGLAPWVLVNYVGQVGDVLTLAHELGHAIHALVASDHSILTFRSSLPLAETASVFSEMLMNDRLLRMEDDPDVRRGLLAHLLDGAYATIARQTYFVLFEIEAHRRVVEGATSEDLCDIYLANLKEQFGDAVEISDDFRWEWTVIPHIYEAPFYCYAYSFGQLLVLALYREYRREGADFVPRYLKILSYGGAASPTTIIGEAGFDITSPAFWQGGFDVLAGFLDELEGL